MKELNTETVTVRIPPSLKGQLDSIAVIEGENIAVIHRRALKRYAASFFSSAQPLKGIKVTEEDSEDSTADTPAAADAS